MTPEQMREAAAKVAADVKTELANSAVGECISNIIAKRIRAIPITAPEPAMTDRMADAVFADTGNLCSRGTTNRVLETMREPTEAMLAAGANTSKNAWFHSREEVRQIYHAMIDAALAE